MDGVGSFHHTFLGDFIFGKCFQIEFKGTRCLGSVEMVFEKRSVTVCYKMHMGRKIL